MCAYISIKWAIRRLPDTFGVSIVNLQQKTEQKLNTRDKPPRVQQTPRIKPIFNLFH